MPRARPANCTDRCAELEVPENDIDSYSHYIVPLYKRALLSRYSHLGGLDDYLTELFVSRRPTSLVKALARLRMFWDVLQDLSKFNEPPEQCDKMQARRPPLPLARHQRRACSARSHKVSSHHQCQAPPRTPSSGIEPARPRAKKGTAYHVTARNVHTHTPTHTHCTEDVSLAPWSNTERTKA